jgi:hypothetical protein
MNKLARVIHSVSFPARVLGAAVTINLATVAAVLLASCHLVIDVQAGNWSAVVADAGTILAALGLPAIFPSPVPQPH